MTVPLLTLWQRGIYLGKAPFAFAPKAEKEEYGRLHDASALQAASEAAQAAAAAKSDISFLEGLNAAVRGARPIASARADWDNRMRKFVLHHLKHGNLYAFGFEPPRRMDSQPVEVPATYWSGTIRWDKASLSVQGLEFVEIRIVSRQLRNQLLERGNVEVTAVSSVGRPTVGPSVQAAFKALEKAGEIDLSASQQSHFPKVRSWLETNFPNLSVPAAKISDKTIHKYFSPLFNDLKKNSNL